MRNIAIIVGIGCVLYGIGSFAEGANRNSRVVTAWEGQNVLGLVCLAILNKESKFPESANLWVVANEAATNARVVQGVTCVDVPLSPRSVIRAEIASDDIEIKVMKDYTGRQIAVVIPE